MASRPRIVLFALVSLSAACAVSEPPPAPEPPLIQLYCDLALISDVTGPPAPDSLRLAVFERHGTTPEEFEEALRPYREDPRGWVLFFKAVVDTMEARVQNAVSATRVPEAGPPSPDR